MVSRLLAYDLVHRTPNPLHGKVEGVAEPLWLYQLTPAGEARREQLKAERAAFEATIR
jgi:hypothetical protein